MTPSIDQRLKRFARHLLEEGLAPGTIQHYTLILRAGLSSGNLQAPFQRAGSRSRRWIALSALRRWADWSRDPILGSWVTAVEQTIHASLPPPVPARLTARQRARLAAAVEQLPDPSRLALLFLIWSGMRLGDVLRLPRADLSKTAAAGCRRCPRTIVRSLLATPGWGQVGDLWSRVGYVAQYAAVRRQIRQACAAAKLEYVQPEEFRRLALAEAKVVAAKAKVVAARAKAKAKTEKVAGKTAAKTAAKAEKEKHRWPLHLFPQHPKPAAPPPTS